MKNKIILFLRLISAAILIQTLYFKFTGAAESKFIFSTLGVEPWGRIGAGLSELVASVLLLIPVTQALGALLSAAIMGGAIASHLFILGIVIENDGGLLFSLACIVLLFSSIIVFLRRDQLSRLYVRK